MTDSRNCKELTAETAKRAIPFCMKTMQRSPNSTVKHTTSTKLQWPPTELTSQVQVYVANFP